MDSSYLESQVIPLMLDQMELTTVEQVKALLHPLRQKVIDILQKGPATPSEVGRAVGIAASKAHYHVHVLEAAGLVKLVETRRVGSVTEKYYEAVARDFTGNLTPNANVKGSSLLPMLESEVKSLMADLARYARQDEETGERSVAMASLIYTEALPEKWAEIEQVVGLMKERFDKAVTKTPGRRYRLMLALVPTEDAKKEEGPR